MQWDKSERNTSEKSTLQTSPNWRANLPRLEGALFQGLVAWRIIFFTSETIFWKFTHRGFQKCPIFQSWAIFGWETGCQRKKSAFWPLRSPNPLPAASGLGNQTSQWSVSGPIKKVEKWSAQFPDKQQKSFQMREERRLLWILDYTISTKKVDFLIDWSRHYPKE